MVKMEDALEYHRRARRGKLEITPTKPCLTQLDLSLAYSPGVAAPCREIAKNQEDVYEYTARGNLVAVISNGSAVLGLGNIGPYASKPVMEGKAILFKKFADIDVFDIELNLSDPDQIIQTVKALEPTFGGVNLEDIKAPECFYIEEKLQEILNIPVFHDDQHGTAIISGAALLNALELVNKKISEVIVVINGAGAAGIASAHHYVDLGVSKENIIMCDSRGVIYQGREGRSNSYKEEFAIATDKRTLADAMKDADVFLGYSVGGVVTPEMLKNMNRDPIVFALANPDPEISYPEAINTRSDVIMATGRSDFPNQVNNVLGFPAIFRGALDVRAKAINKEMKIAATRALAKLTREPVPPSVAKAYGVKKFEFGRDYIIAKPFDPRVITWEATAVAKAAMDTGVARMEIDLAKYQENLELRMGQSREVVRNTIAKARREPKKIVYPEGENEKILHACSIIAEEKIAHPVLIGRKEKIHALLEKQKLSVAGLEIIEPRAFPALENYIEYYHKLRQRKGVTTIQARDDMLNPLRFALMMVRQGDADGIVAGISQSYPDTIRPALQIIGKAPGVEHVAGMYLIVIKNNVKLFADATVNIDTSPQTLADIAILTAQQAKNFDIEPRIAMLSFSNFGSSRHPLALKVKEATEIVRQKHPHLMIDGEMSVDMAIDPELRSELHPFCYLEGQANVLIFPDLTSGNIAYKLMQRVANADTLGPILMGMNKPVHLLQIGSSEVKDAINMTAIAVVEAQRKE